MARPGSQRIGSARKFLREYRRYRFGTLGIIIIAIFSVMATLAPYLTSYNPIFTTGLASPYSAPAWAKAFPQYSDYPVNSQLLLGTALSSKADLGSWNIQAVGPSGSQGGSIEYSPGSGGLLVNLTAPGSVQIGTKFPVLYLNQTISYPWSYGCHFSSIVSITSLHGNLSTSALTVDEYITSVGGKTYHVLGPATYTAVGDHFTFVKYFRSMTPSRLWADSSDGLLNILATNKIAPNLGPCGITQGIFTRPGNVTVSYVVSSSVTAQILVSSPSLNMQGRAFGVLGTDSLGRDVWSQFVYGARVSLIVGLVASLIAVIVGTLVGVVAGYMGGFLDEFLMRFTDFLLILPFLPLLLIIITIISVGNINFPFGNEFLIILIIAVFSWEGIARIIRSQVLSLKSRQFVEASRALGAGEGHIIWRHILPNVTGLIYANLALTVPGAILTEAAVTFLGFGDPTVISWGTMVSNAQQAVTSTIHSFVWWWFLPPGLAIATLSMAFLFVGFALDSVLNPRLRER